MPKIEDRTEIVAFVTCVALMMTLEKVTLVDDIVKLVNNILGTSISDADLYDMVSEFTDHLLYNGCVEISDVVHPEDFIEMYTNNDEGVTEGKGKKNGKNSTS